LAVNSLKMNLSFLFNATDLTRGLNRAAKSFEHADKVSKFMRDEKLFGSATIGINNIQDALRNTTVAAGATGETIRSIMNSPFSGDYLNTLDQVMAGTQKIGDNLGVISQETINWASMQAGVDASKKAAEQIEDLNKHFEKMGIFLEGNQLQNFTVEMTKLNVESPKLAKSLHGVVEEAQELHKGMDLKQQMLYREHLMKLTEALDKGEISMKDYIKSQKLLNYQTDVINNKLPELKKQLGGLFSGPLGQLTGGVAAFSSVTDAINAQDQALQTVHQTAMQNANIFYGQEKSAQNFTKTVWDMDAAVRDVGGATQISMAKAAEAINSLAAARVPGTIKDLKDLAITSVQMQQAFGIAEGQAAQLIQTLSLAGGLDKKSIKEVGEAFADVQSTLGLTSEEATEAASTVGRVINRMSQMGASSIKNAKIVAREVAKMTATFTRAGLSAQDASAMMDRFMDPTKIEDNAFLWSQMGISVADGLQMMTGDASSMEGMTEKLTKAAIDLKQQYGDNPLALQAMAEAYGMTIQQVNQLSGEYERQLKLGPEQRKEMEAQATLEKQAAQSKESLSKKIDQLAAVGNMLIATFVMPLMDLFMGFINYIAMPVINFFGGIVDWIKTTIPFGKEIVGVIQGIIGAILLFTLLTQINVFKMLGSFNLLKGAKGFGGLFSSVIDGAKGAIGAFGAFGKSIIDNAKAGMSPLKNLGDSFKNAFGNKPPAAPGPAGSIPPTPDASGAGPKPPPEPPKPKGPSFLEQLSKVKASTLFALAGAILAVGAAIFLIAYGFSLLADSLQKLDLGQLLTLFGLAIVIMGGFALILNVLSKSLQNLGTVGWPAAGVLLAIGAAIFLIAAGFSLLALSIAALNTNQLIALVGLVIIIMGGFIAMVFALASATPALATASAGLTALGISMLLIAGAIAIVVLSVAALVLALSTAPNILTSLVGLGAGLVALGVALITFGSIIMAALIPIGIGIGTLAALGVALLILGASLAMVAPYLAMAGTSMMLLAPALLLLGSVGPGLLAASAGIALLGGAMWALIAAIPAMFILSAIFPSIAESFASMSTGISGITASIAGLSTFVVLLTTLSSIGVGMIALGLGLVGFATGLSILTAIAQPLSKTMPLIVGAVNQLINVLPGLTAIAAVMTTLAPSFIAFAASLGILTLVLIPFSLVMLSMVAMIPAFLLIGFALGGIANSFSMMGTGIKMFADNISIVLTGIDTLKTKLDGFAGMSKAFTDEIDKMSASLVNLAGPGGLGIVAMMSMAIAPTKSGGDSAGADAAQAAQMQTIVDHLDDIKTNTSDTVKQLVIIASKLSNNNSAIRSDSLNVPM